MADYKEVPIAAAERIAEEFDKDQVILVTWDNAHGMQHVTTYGKSRKSSAQAAQGGNFVKKALGWPNDLTNARPEWWVKACEQLGNLADTVDNYRAAMDLPMPPQFHLAQLKNGLDEISATLKAIYTAMTQENPWDKS